MTVTTNVSSAPRITCPRCGMTSFHPQDIAEGYCGNCHDWTRQDEHDPAGGSSMIFGAR